MHSSFLDDFTPGALEDVTVLLVDDDTFIRAQVSAILERVVGEVFTAEDGETALAVLASETPDILITDIVMPGMDGLDLADHVRRIDPDIPIFVATGVDEPELLIKAVERDIDQLLLKPLLPDALVAAIRKTVRRVDMRRRLVEAESALRLIMDTYPNHVVLVDQGRIAYLNEGLRTHLGLESFEAFRDSGASLGDFFAEFDGEEYPGGEGWIDSLVGDQLDRERMVRIPNPRDPGRRAGTFVIGHKEFPTPGKFLITLTDVSELEDRSRHLHDQASTDPLTGLLNRRSFTDLLEQASLGGRPFSVIMFDIDHFKRINDDFGHDAGDAVLQEMAKLVQSNVRNSDVVSRWGGEEFMVLSPDSDVRRANRVAERLRRKIEGGDFPGVNRVVTSSFGVAQHVGGQSLEALLKRVDDALYRAKDGGRNRVVVDWGPTAR